MTGQALRILLVVGEPANKFRLLSVQRILAICCSEPAFGRAHHLELTEPLVVPFYLFDYVRRISLTEAILIQQLVYFPCRRNEICSIVCSG